MEWETLEISSRKLEIQKEYFRQRWRTKRQNSVDLTEEEYIKRRWQAYIEEPY